MIIPCIVDMTVTESPLTVDMTVDDGSVTMDMQLDSALIVRPIPRNYGLITYNGSWLMVS